MACAHAGEVAYRDFSARLHRAAAARRVPVSGSWELTARCNLACPFCYLAGAPRAPAARAREVPTARILDIADQLVDAGCLWLALTGGEPLLRPDFAEIYRGLIRRGLVLTLLTNGTLVTAEIADLLAERPPLAVEITLYGATAATFDEVTGVPGSHARCWQGLAHLRQRGLSLRLKTTVCRRNVAEVPAMEAQARDLGLPFRFDALLNPRLDGGREPLAHRLAPAEAAALDGDPTRRAAFETAARGCVAPDRPRERLYQCGAGLTGFHLDATGCLTGCLLLHEPAVDLGQVDFATGWERLARLRDEPWTVDVPCRTCRWLDLCFQCPAWASIETQSNQSIVKHLCGFTQERLLLSDMEQNGSNT